MDVIEMLLDNYRPTNEKTFTPIDRLFAKLTHEDIARIEKIAAERDIPLPSKEGQYRFWVVEMLRIGASLLNDIAVKTGLTNRPPPPDVHSMQRLNMDVGSLYHPNLIDEVLTSVGRQVAGRVLDFGCSSGRIARVLKAAFPEIDLYGCDPERRTIEWAKSNFSTITFDVSPFSPPSRYDSSFFDLVYAVSIWSHFDEPSAIDWFNEMHRIVKPGGLLYWTTHGRQSLAQWQRQQTKPTGQLGLLASKLVLENYVFEKVYDQDWGADTSRWGLAYIAPEWVLTSLLGKWRVLQYRPGYESWNQDVYLMERV